MEKYNADELAPPKWMDEGFFEMILSQYFNENKLQIKRVNITPGSSKNDHYASIMFSAGVDYTTSGSNQINSIALIVKATPEAEGNKKELIERLSIFETEVLTYNHLMPRFEKLLQRIGDNTQLYTKTIYTSLSPRNVLVFRDLRKQGYDCIRGRPLTLDEIKGCLLKIAKWHAVGFKLVEENDESVHSFPQNIWSKPIEEWPQFAKVGIKCLANAVSKMDGFEMYAEKLQALDPIVFQTVCEMYTSNSSKARIITFTHGDFHRRNVMFKMNSKGDTEDAMLIDFQICCYAPAAVDIIYALFMMCDYEHRKNNREELIHYYFSIFLDTLKKLGVKENLPTLMDFYMDLYKCKEYEILLWSTFLPLQYDFFADSPTLELDDVLSKSDVQEQLYYKPCFVEELKWLLPFYLHRGYLN